MVKKVLIQVVSVFTLVFGTCYQSVLALADNVGQFEIHSSKVMDKEGNAVERVKAGSKQNLVFEMTINNKDGDKAAGSTNVFIPENQMKVLKDKVSAESSIPDAKASLYLSKKRNLRLKWSGVNNSATFKLEVPVKIGNPMTLTDLPVAVDDATSYTQQMIVLAEDADDDAVSEAITDNDLPTNLTLQLDNYLKQVEAQKAQEAQQEADDQAQTAQEKADAATKKAEEDEAAAKEAEEKEAAEQKAAEEKKAKEEAAAKLAEKEKLEAEEKAKAEAEAEQEKENQAAAEEKTIAKARSALKSHSDEGSEADDRSSARAGRSLNEILKSGQEGPVSLFDNITLKIDGTEPFTVANEQTFDPSLIDGKEFDLTYTWTVKKLNAKLEELGAEAIQTGDTYSFEIQGLEKLSNSIVSEPIYATVQDKEIIVGFYSIKNEGNNQVVTIEFAEGGIDESTEFWMTINQKYMGDDPIVFEWNDEKVISMDPSTIDGVLSKSGQFISNTQIQWTVEMDVVKVGSDLKFSDLSFDDILSVKNGTHIFDEDSLSLTATYKDSPNKDLTGQFTHTIQVDKDKELTQLIIEGVGDEAIDTNETIVFTFISNYTVTGAKSLYQNEISGLAGGLKLKEATSTVSRDIVKKSNDAAKDGKYPWTITVDLKDFALTSSNIQNLIITDTLTGNHEFASNPEMSFTVKNESGDEIDVSTYFKAESEDGKTMTITVPKQENYDELIALLTQNELVIKYDTVSTDGEGTPTDVNNEVTVSLKDDDIDGGSNTGQSGGLVVKTGELKYGDYRSDDTVETEWTLTINAAKYKFETLTIIDVLPGKLAETGIKMLVNGESVDLENYEEGFSSRTKHAATHQYDFYDEESSAAKYHALKISFDKTYSEKTITLTFSTYNNWDDIEGKYFVNRASAITGSGFYEDAKASVYVKDDIVENAFKHGKNMLDGKDNSTVKWTIGVGTHLNSLFGAERKANEGDGSQKDRVSEVTITDTVNLNAAYEYLTLPTETSAYSVYTLKSSTDLSLDEKLKDDMYDLTIGTNGEITITFKNDTDDIKSFALVFETPIDFDKWQSDEETRTVPTDFVFNNNATISYDGIADDLKVKASTGMVSDGLYLKKNHSSVEGNVINWNAVINPDSQTLRKLKIVDELSGNHEAIVSSFKIYEAEKVSYKLENGKLVAYVDPQNGIGTELKQGVDYTVTTSKEDNSFRIEMNGTVSVPLYFEYQTYITANDGNYGNKITVNSVGYSDETSHTVTASAGGYRDSRFARFQKVDGDDHRIELEGATFKLEQLSNVNADKNDESNWSAAKDIFGETIGEVTSDENGHIEFLYLGTSTTYRVVETQPADDYSNAMAPIMLEATDYNNWSGKTQLIENWPTGPTANITIHKAVERLGTDNTFEFEIRAYRSMSDNEVDTTFSGEYETEGSGSDSQKIVFKKGVATFNLTGNTKLTIKDLPVYVPSAKGDDKTKFQYIVKETSESDDYSTQVKVDGHVADYTEGKETAMFNLNEKGNGPQINVYFKNIGNPVGEILLKKVGINNLDSEQSFDFDISTTAKANDIYHATLTKPGNENPTKFMITFDDNGHYSTQLKAGEELLIADLPKGNYKVSERGVDGVRVSWTTTVAGESITSPALDAGKGGETDEFKVIGDTTSEVTFTNKPTTTSLELEKIVSSEGRVDTEKKFEFTLQGGAELANLEATIQYSYSNGGSSQSSTLKFDDKGNRKITLTHRQKATISGLPDGAEIKITETVEKGYDTSSTVEDGVGNIVSEAGHSQSLQVKEDETLLVTFLNSTQPAGFLQIKKTVIGQLNQDSFNFKVTALNDLQPDGDYVVAITDFDGRDILSETINFNKENGNWVAEVTLAGDQYAVIRGLPMGSYQVEETTTDANMVTRNKVNNGAWKTSPVSENMILKDNGDLTTAHYENSAVAGHLEITKQTDTSQLNDQAFKFTVRATGNNFALTGEFKESTLNGEQHQVEFENGVMSENLKPGDVLKIAGLPVGEYEITEENQTGIVTTYTTNSGQVVGNVTTETIKKNQTSKATFTNNQTEFTLGKIVANETDSDEEFDFTLESRGLAGQTFTTANNGDVSFNHRGRAKVTVKAGEQLTILGLPVGARIKVVEIENENYNHATSSVINGQDSKDGRERTVTIPKNSHLLNLTFINSKNPVGALTVEKQVSGNMATETFNFEVSGLDGLKLDGEYQIQKFENGKQVGGPSTITFEKNAEGVWVAPIELKDNQYVMIIGLPIGAYNVTELDPKEEGMVTTFQLNGDSTQSGMTVDTGRIEKNGDLQTVKFINTMPEPETGNLSIQKKLTGAVTEADQNADYSFNVTAYKDGTTDSTDTNDTETETDGNETDSTATEDGDKDGDATTTSTTIDTSFNGTVDAIKRTADGVEHKTQVDFTDGQASITLKAGVRLTILDIPTGTKMSFSETPVAGMTTTNKLDENETIAGTETGLITIGNNTTRQVVFTNDRAAQPETAWLSLTKTVLGGGDTDMAFEFTIRLTNNSDGAPVTGIVNYIKTDAWGSHPTNTLEFDSSGLATISLSHAQTIRLNVPNGTHYQVSEADYSADGYATSTTVGNGAETDGTEAVGIAQQDQSNAAVVVYYNRFDTTEEEEYPSMSDDEEIPSLPAAPTDDSSGTSNGATPSTTGGTGTSSGSYPAMSSGSGGTSSGTSGVLPKTGEFIANNWATTLGLILGALLAAAAYKKTRKQD